MTEVTQILSQIEQGDPSAAEQLLPLVYDELRKLAAAKLAHERPGQTLQATALVHDAYIRLVDVEQAQHWDSRQHFFAAAAEAMRRILVETARRKKRIKHGGDLERVELDGEQLAVELPVDDLLAINEALEQLEASDEQSARLVKLRYFTGLSVEDAAELLGISPRTAYRDWSYARAWMYRRLGGERTPPAEGSQ
jgi:RNA polymerase sigma factor (TIGR02999 family)